MSQVLDTARNAYWRARGLPKSPLVLLGHTGRVRSVAFLPDGKEVISGGEDGSARRWRVEDGCELGRAIREKGPVVAVASSDGNWIATGGEENNTITIWTAATRDKVVILEGHTDHVWSLAFSPDSASVVSGSKDKTVIVWSTTTGECLLGRLRGHTGPIWCACFSPNGDKIASCDSVDIRIWNSQSGDQVVLRRIASPSFVTWTPDHELIVGCKNGSIKRFSSSIVSLLATRSAHTDWVCSIAVSPNGKFMASASCDKTIRLWNMMTFTQIGPTLQCHVEVWSIAISPAGDHLVSGGRGGRVRIWSLKGMISRALLVDMPATSDAMAGANDSSSSSTLIMPAHWQREVLSTLDEPLFEQPPPPPPKTIINGQGKGSGSLVLPVARGSNVSSGSSIVKDSTPFEQPTQHTPWNIVDIRSSFPNDLTGSVTRAGEHPFASGSYGDIYRGTLRVRGKSTDVAVKAIKTYFANDGDDAGKKKRLNREIRVWLDLKHVNVLPLFGTTMDFGQFPAMVCPWLEDGPLTSYLERRNDSLTTVERLILVADVAVGLQYLHSQTVVHGDLSGSNVLVQPGGRACISDFGMSTLLSELGGSTLPTSLQGGGTLRWAAPELLDLQVPDNADNLRKVVPTPQSDIYSFGGIMLQALTGKVPYHYYPREARVLHAISKGEIPKRPNQPLVTDRRWSFIQQCWTPDDGDTSQSRPSDDAIVEFTRNELLQSVIPQV